MAITKEEITTLEKIVSNKKFFIEGASLYGMKKILFDYLSISNDLPQSFYLDHGVPLYDEKRPLNAKILKTRFPLVLLTNEDQLKLYKDHLANKTTMLVGALFPKYRQMNQLHPQPDRVGTIVFPSHSTLQVDVVQGWSDYAQQLKKLPDHFHPITVCLYWVDVLKGRHIIFEQEGLEVMTMGHFSRQDFAHKFYSTVQHFRYACSNEYGSYLPYCVEMGIPFFIYGNQFVNQNVSQHNYYPEGRFTYSQAMGLNAYDQVRQLFALNESQPVINAQQRRFVEHILGLGHPIDKHRLKEAILLSSKANFPNHLKTRIHKLLWDIIYLGPPAFSDWMEKKIKPFYIKQNI